MPTTYPDSIILSPGTKIWPVKQFFSDIARGRDDRRWCGGHKELIRPLSVGHIKVIPSITGGGGKNFSRFIELNTKRPGAEYVIALFIDKIIRDPSDADKVYTVGCVFNYKRAEYNDIRDSVTILP